MIRVCSVKWRWIVLYVCFLSMPFLYGGISAYSQDIQNSKSSTQNNIKKRGKEEVFYENSELIYDKEILAKEKKLKDYLKAGFSSVINEVKVGKNEILVKGNLAEGVSCYIVDIPIFEEFGSDNTYKGRVPIPVKSGPFTVKLKRTISLNGEGYDRLLSKWVIVQKNKNGYELKSHARYADSVEPAYKWPGVKLKNKKGLGGFALNRGPVSDLDDLDIGSVTVNIRVASFLRSEADKETIEFTFNGKPFYVNRKLVLTLDSSLRVLSGKNIAVAAIVLIDKIQHCPDKEIGKIFQHPGYLPEGHYSMANMSSKEGFEYYAAIMDYLAHRYSLPGKPYGHIDHWIIHNEVNAGWVWTNMGKVPPLIFMNEYQKSMRMVYYLARKYNSTSKVFISLTHYWAQFNDPHFYRGSELMDILLDYSKKEGDFDWAVAIHPYPQNLFNPKSWLDKKVDYTFNTPMITFKNVEVIDKWVEQPYTLYKGKYIRPIWFSEQGLNSLDYSNVRLEEQAAGMAYAWEKLKRLKNVEAFQYHNWVDNKREGGLRIGLRRFPEDSAAPMGVKPIWDVFKAAGTNQEAEAFRFAKKIIGISDWEEIMQKETAAKPNVLFIQCDQFRYDCQSRVNPMIKTPNLDKLVSEGMFFSRAFTPIPTCCPARQSFLSGKWPSQHKGLWNYDITLPVALFEENTWTERMQEAGYKQAYIGKWHVHPTKTPLDFGFQQYISDEDYNNWRKSQKLPAPVPAIKGFAWIGGKDRVSLETTRTHWLAQKAIDQLKVFKEGNSPWHLRVEFVEPHLPANPVERFINLYTPAEIKPWGNFPARVENKPFIQQQMAFNWGIENYTWKEWSVYLQHYYAMISQADDAIGMILTALKDMGLDDNTVVIFTSDHGDAAGSHGLIDKHYVMYDEEVRVPLVVKWPGVVKPGTESDNIVLNGLDLSATIPQLAGFEFKQSVGHSLLPILKGEKPSDWRKYAYSDYNGQQFGLYVQRMIRNDKVKYVWNLTDIDELYDLQKDPWEMNNLIADPSYQDILKVLRHDLYNDLQERKDPIVNWGGKKQLLEGKKISTRQ